MCISLAYLFYLFYLYVCSESASCTHVSGLLHALVAMCPSKLEFISAATTSEDPLPVTSYPCQWKLPRKRKDNSAKVSELAFHKHVFGQQKKHTLSTLSDFDPRPPEHQGTAPHLLKDFLTKVKGKGLGVSLLFENDTAVWKDECDLSNEQSEPNAITIFLFVFLKRLGVCTCTRDSRYK